MHETLKKRQPCRGLLCLSIAEKEEAQILFQAQQLVYLADIVEIRLDSMIQPDIGNLVGKLGKPILVTNRAKWEGGAWAGSEEQRIAVLLQAVAAGARYVDIELRTERGLRDKIIQAAYRHEAWPLVSWHNFSETPQDAQLSAIYEEMKTSGANSGKIVTTAQAPSDAVRLLALLERVDKKFPLSTFAMGEAGAVTRFACLYLGGHISYASLGGEKNTAPGQIGIIRLRNLCSLFEERS